MEFTKERLLKIQSWSETYGPGSNVVLPAEEAEGLARIALASLEAEPVAYIIQDKADRKEGNRGQLSFKSVEQYHEKDINEHELTATPLYTAPPAPVSVPEPIKRNDADGWWMYKGRRVGGGCAEWYNRALDDCRAAMLQGADGNSPVVPDGWVMVPVEPTAEMQSAAAGAIRFDTTPINKLWTGNAVYRAMIAAAPQQEVK